MNPIGYIALYTWPLVAIVLASWLRVPRSVVASCIVAWLFLPEGGFNFPGPIDLSKVNVTSLSILLGIALIEPKRLTSLRPGWADLPMGALCVSSLFSSLSNGLGPYDGLAESLAKTLSWGIPWIVGRACFTSIADLRALAVGMVLGGVAYIPLCLYEVRMSPQLHRMVYGFFPHAEFNQTRRFGGFRPNVFMQHGLMVGLWMCTTALIGAWMWRGMRQRTLLGVPMAFIVPAQIATAVLCKSAGAIVLGASGWGVLLVTAWTRSRVALLVLALAPSAYVAFRVADGPTQGIVDIVNAAPIISERVDSLDYRFEAEGILLEHAMQRPLFGWGGYGRHRPLNDDGDELARTDSLWVITLGQNGILGVAGLYAALTLPLLIVATRLPVASLLSPKGAPILIAAVVVAIYACDSLFNAMFNPVYVMAAGGVVATVATISRTGQSPAAAGAAHGTAIRAAGGPAATSRSRVPAVPLPQHAAPALASSGPRLQSLDPDTDNPGPQRRRPLEAPASRAAAAPSEPSGPHPFPAPTPTPQPDRLSIPWRAPRS